MESIKPTSAADHQSALLNCAMAARMLIVWDLPAMLAAIERADAFGPLLDPTLWRDKHKLMEEDRQLLNAALPLWRWGRKMQQAADEALVQTPREKEVKP